MKLIAGTCGLGDHDWRTLLVGAAGGAAVHSIATGPCHFSGSSDTAEAVVARDRSVAVVADARLDNRADLARRLGLAKSLPDPALIACAWMKWGQEAPTALLGDYAFALYDARVGLLWLVRDAVGMRPLAFVSRGDGAAFSSLPSHLATFAGSTSVDPSLARRRVPGSRTHPNSWFAGVEQVQPGERVRINHGRALRSFWWQPSTQPSFAGSRSDLALAMGDALKAAVADRIGTERKVATHLSAGLDSAAVTVAAAEQLQGNGAVIAITARPTPGAALLAPAGRLPDETAHAAAIAACCRSVRHVTVDAGARSIAEDLMLGAPSFAQPLTNPINFGWFAESCAAAREAGARRLLAGQLGNFALSAAATDYWWPILRREGWSRLASEWRHAPRSHAPLAELARRARGAVHSQAEARLALIRSIDPGLFLKGVERDGIEIVDPTADRRVIELVLTVPENLLVRNGDTRWVARELLRGRVPDMVLDEPRRGFQAADWLSRLRAEADVLADMLRRAGALGIADFEESLALLLAIQVGPSLSLDAESRRRLGPDLALAAFLLSATASGDGR